MIDSREHLGEDLSSEYWSSRTKFDNVDGVRDLGFSTLKESFGLNTVRFFVEKKICGLPQA